MKQAAAPRGRAIRPAARPAAAAPEPGPAAMPVAAMGGVLVLAAAVWILFRVRTGIVLEDALITYRHAENLALGRGFGFNPGEPVLGTTTPLLTLMLAAVAKLAGAGSIPLASNALMIAAALGSALLLGGMLLRSGLSPAFAVLAVLFVNLNPDMLWSTVGGLETPLVIFLMALGLDGALRERWNRAAAAAALLVLARVDGAVWAAILLVAAAFRLRWRALRPLAIGVAVLAPWLVFAWRYFGSVVPHTVVAKQAIGFGPGSVKYLPWLLNSLGVSFLGDLTPVEYAVWTLFVAAGLGAILADPARRRFWPLAVYPAAFGIALWLGRAPAFEWYVVPVTWCGLVVGALGSLEWRRMLEAYGAQRGWRRWVPQVIFAGAWIVVALGVAGRDVGAFAYHRANQENEDATRRRIGEWLRDHSKPGATVAMEAIGYEGTFSRRRVIDLAGVVSPEVVRIQRESRTNAQAFERVLDRFRPEFLVLRSYEVDRNRHQHGGPLFETQAARDSFTAHYREVLRVTAPHAEQWGDNAQLAVFERDVR